MSRLFHSEHISIIKQMQKWLKVHDLDETKQKEFLLPLIACLATLEKEPQFTSDTVFSAKNYSQMADALVNCLFGNRAWFNAFDPDWASSGSFKKGEIVDTFQVLIIATLLERLPYSFANMVEPFESDQYKLAESRRTSSSYSHAQAQLGYFFYCEKENSIKFACAYPVKYFDTGMPIAQSPNTIYSLKALLEKPPIFIRWTRFNADSYGCIQAMDASRKSIIKTCDIRENIQSIHFNQQLPARNSDSIYANDDAELQNLLNSLDEHNKINFIAAWPLKQLYVKSATIGLVGATALARIINEAPMLMGLNILYTTIPTTSGVELILEAVKSNKTLNHLDISGSTGLIIPVADAISAHPTITSFRVDRNRERFGVTGIRTIASLLEKNTQLRSITMEENCINDAGMQVITDAVKQGAIERIYLGFSDNLMTLASIYPFAKKIAKSSSPLDIGFAIKNYFYSSQNKLLSEFMESLKKLNGRGSPLQVLNDLKTATEMLASLCSGFNETLDREKPLQVSALYMMTLLNVQIELSGNLAKDDALRGKLLGFITLLVHAINLEPNMESENQQASTSFANYQQQLLVGVDEAQKQLYLQQAVQFVKEFKFDALIRFNDKQDISNNVARVYANWFQVIEDSNSFEQFIAAQLKNASSYGIATIFLKFVKYLINEPAECASIFNERLANLLGATALRATSSQSSNSSTSTGTGFEFFKLAASGATSSGASGPQQRSDTVLDR